MCTEYSSKSWKKEHYSSRGERKWLDPWICSSIEKWNMPIQYVVDEVAARSGHVVLQLPPYYCVLNPIEMVWSTLKKGITKNNSSPNFSANVVD